MMSFTLLGWRVQPGKPGPVSPGVPTRLGTSASGSLGQCQLQLLSSLEKQTAMRPLS